jgi:hypothetical protein
VTFAECLDGREKDGKSFADARGRFDEEAAAGLDVAISGDGHGALAGAVGERKFQGGGGRVSNFDPPMMFAEPLEIFGEDRIEKDGELLTGEILGKFGRVEGIEFGVSEPDGGGSKMVLLSIEMRVDTSLGPMERMSENTLNAGNRFDFLDPERAVLDKNAIDPAFQVKRELGGIKGV